VKHWTIKLSFHDKHYRIGIYRLFKLFGLNFGWMRIEDEDTGHDSEWQLKPNEGTGAPGGGDNPVPPQIIEPRLSHDRHASAEESA
jgi:hypothetical protein